MKAFARLAEGDAMTKQVRRPEGFKNPHCSKFLGVDAMVPYEIPLHKAFEAGADAMLRCLKKNVTRVEVKINGESLTETSTGIGHSGKGIWVFIEEEHEG